MKNKNKKQSETEPEVKKSPGIFMKLFLIAMPLFILAVIGVFVLHIAGFNTLDWLKERSQSIPVVGEMFTDESNEEISELNDLQALQNQLESRNEIINNKDEQIQELEETIADLESEISSLEEEQEENENNEDTEQSNEQQGGEQAQAEAGAVSEKSSMTRTLEGMKSKEAAAILENLEADLAVTILEEMSTGDRGDILQQMNVEAATTYTQMLME
ncbi:magnesium transporter MgtE N-terminal domain-containing protein [Oceanobacillus oncorhynchi]|uniref:magnesium transporter MgtE N-terminal domain-containing protein n=1 Tax=Oceanobacillus oncorhynchi TaxID=545501 RepID=UPI002F96A2DB